jgi:hypothetical protein
VRPRQQRPLGDQRVLVDFAVVDLAVVPVVLVVLGRDHAVEPVFVRLGERLHELHAFELFALQLLVVELRHHEEPVGRRRVVQPVELLGQERLGRHRRELQLVVRGQVLDPVELLDVEVSAAKREKPLREPQRLFFF